MQKIMTGISCLAFAAASLIVTTPAAFSVTTNESLQPIEKENLANDDPWVQMSSSQRQAYVGIHGGTAPITLLRSPDGVIYAFTGQTGNDFVQTLRSGNASHPPRTDTPAPVLAETSLTPPSAVINATAQLNAESSSTPVAEDTPSRDDYFITASLIAEEETVYNTWADSPQWIASLVAGASEATYAPSEEIMAAKPENYPQVVFATHEGSMSSSETEFAPFGLASQDLPSHDTLVIPVIIKDRKKVIIPVRHRTNKIVHRPLVLNDYRKVL